MNKLIRWLFFGLIAVAFFSAERVRASGSCTCGRFNNFKDHGCHGSPAGPGSPPSGANNAGGNTANCPTCPPPRELTGPDEANNSTGATGMPRWWVSEPYINLHVVDEPLSYTMSSGKQMVFRFTYKQDYSLPTPDQIPDFYYTYFNVSRDNDEGNGAGTTVFPYIHSMQSYATSNAPYIGNIEQEMTNGMTNAAWMHNWQECIVLWDSHWETYLNQNGIPPSSRPYADGTYEALSFMPDGGIDYFTSGVTSQTLDAATQSRDPVSQAQLQSFPNSFYPTPFYTGAPDGNGIYWGTTTNGLRLVYPDGSIDVFGLTFCVSNANRVVPDTTAVALLTERIDPQGRTTTLGYTYTTFTDACNAETFSFYRLKYVVDPDGQTSTFVYTSSSVMPSELQEIDDPFGRKATFGYNTCGSGVQRGWLTSITDAQTNTSEFGYQSGKAGWMSSLTTPYGANNFYYYYLGGDSSITNSFTDRAIYVTEPESASQLFAYIHNESNTVEASATPPIVPGCVFDTGANGGGDEALYHRNSFYWDRRQTPNLSVFSYLPSNLAGAIARLTANDLQKGRMQHWLLDGDGISITETLSSERDPSPDNEGTIEGERTWYSYGDSTPADEYSTSGITSDVIAAIARVLPDTSSQYTKYSYGNSSVPWVVTQSAESFTKTDGTIGTFNNYFTYGTPNFIDVLNISNSLGQYVNLGYNANHEVKAVTNALQQVSTYAYNTGTQNLTNASLYNGQNISFTYELGQSPYVQQILFQPQGYAINVPSGFGFSGYCNPSGACGFLPLFEQITGTGLADLWITNTWDNLNRLTSVAYPDGTYVSNIYTYLDLSAHKDRLGNWTYYTYDGLQHLRSIKDARNNFTQFTWCDCGALTEISNALSHITSLNYNNQGLLTNINYPDLSSMNWQYDLIGRVKNVTDGATNSLQFNYNNQGFVTSVANIYGQIFGAYYDALGRPLTVTNVNNAVAANSYDLLNRLTTCSWTGGGTEYFGYASNGLVAYTNQDNQWTHFGRDGAERLTSLANAVETNLFGYNGLSELSSLSDGLSNSTTWGYNQYGWLTGKTNALHQNILTYGYDSDGRVMSRAMSGSTTTYGHDAVGNLTSITYPQLTINYYYDAINELTNMADDVGTTLFTYTSNSLLQSEASPWSSDTVGYAYSQGHRTNLSLSQPSGSWSQNYSYDGEWRMKNITSSAGSFAYSYATLNPASPLISGIAFPNGASTANSYDTLGRLTGTSLANQWSHVLDGHNYGLDALGLRKNITRILGLTTNSVALGYDGIDELTSWSATESGGALRHNEQLGYGYDAGGNLHTRTNDALVQTFTVDGLNQLYTVTRTGPLTVTGATPVPAASVTVNGASAQTYGDFTFAGTSHVLANGNNSFTNIAQNIYGVAATNTFTANLPATVSFQYDGNGNLTNDGTRYFQYDAENQLTNISAAGLWRVGYVYDGLNRRRVTREYNWQGTNWAETNETRYIYDGNVVLQERDANNNPQVTYTRGLDLSLSLQGAGGIGGMLARSDATGSYYFHADGNGNITALMDGNQNIVARYEYDPYGKPIGQWGSMANANRYRFSSKEISPQAGIYYYGYRFYEPNFQRWVNKDPIQEIGGINLFGFNANSPTLGVDSVGLIGLADGLFTDQGLTPQGAQSMAELTVGAIASIPAAIDSLSDQTGLTGLVGMPPSDMLNALGGEFGGRMPDLDAPDSAPDEPNPELESPTSSKQSVAKPCPDQYRRVKPSAGLRREIWERNKSENGRVYDPSGREIKPGDPWQAGHIPGEKLSDARQRAADQGWDADFWKQYQQDPDIYRPELPSSNAGHNYENKW